MDTPTIPTPTMPIQNINFFHCIKPKPLKMLKADPNPESRTDLLEQSSEMKLWRHGDVFGCLPIHAKPHGIAYHF